MLLISFWISFEDTVIVTVSRDIEANSEIQNRITYILIYFIHPKSISIENVIVWRLFHIIDELDIYEITENHN